MKTTGINNQYPVIPVEDYYVVVDKNFKVIATISKRIENIPLIKLSDEDIILINNAIDIIKKDKNTDINLKQELIEFLQSVKKVPVSVELEMEMEGHYYGRFIPKAMRDEKGDFISHVYSVKITNPETNTITPVNINYE